jgi:hypothetical protein
MNSLERWIGEQNRADSEAGMTRRSKLLWRVALPVAATALTGYAIFNVAEAAPDAHPYNLEQVHREYTVQPNDSIYGIAERAEPDQDPRDVSGHIIDTIEARDHVDQTQATKLRVGEIVPLPADAAIGDLVIPSQPSH